jgi:RNA polymerase-binding transcription factor DksA
MPAAARKAELLRATPVKRSAAPTKTAAATRPAAAAKSVAKAVKTTKTVKKTPPAPKVPAKTPAKSATAPKKASGSTAKRPTAKATASKATKAKSATTPRPAKAAPAKTAPVKAAPAPPRKTTVTCALSGFEVTPGVPQLAPKTLERLREKLLEEKDRLVRQSDELAAEADELAREREAGDTQFDEESGEGDTVNIERERDLLLSASARQVVEEIEEALLRMKKGTYGVCKYAGRKISVERLEAIPWANVCVDCKARAERRR